MVLSVSSLASAFSHLSLPSTSAPHPLPLVRLHPTTRHAAHPVLSASGADAAEQVEAEAPSADDGPEEVLAVEAEEDTLSGLAPRKLLRSDLDELLLLLQVDDETPCSVVRCLLAGRSLIIFHPEQEKIISPYHLYMNPKLAMIDLYVVFTVATALLQTTSGRSPLLMLLSVASLASIVAAVAGRLVLLLSSLELLPLRLALACYPVSIGGGAA
uniref:Uncharacterized protein n=1 Tax=Aegilops tauschii TaxID=37682 RepID=M8CTJ1_AEGTA